MVNVQGDRPETEFLTLRTSKLENSDEFPGHTPFVPAKNSVSMTQVNGYI
jgi:hypothetical protein